MQSYRNKRKSSGFTKWVVILVLIAAAMFYLQSRVTEQPLTRQEKAVSLDALQK